MRLVVVIACATAVPSAAEPRAARLRKDDVKPAIKTVMPRLDSCYQRARAGDPQLAGVVNTRLAIRSDAGAGLVLKVRGFDTAGTLGASREFLACAKAAFESAKLPALATTGTLDMTYPTTFAPVPPDNKDTSSIEQASRAFDRGQFAEALARAERGLELTSLDGTYRRRLIEIAGLAACQLANADKARAYFELAPASSEERIANLCAKVAGIELLVR